MAHEVIMPMLGMAQDTGKLLTWIKNPGDAVAIGDVLFEVETDKSVSEVEAAAEGYLSRVKAAAGSDIPVGQVIAMITKAPETAEMEAETPAAPPASEKVGETLLEPVTIIEPSASHSTVIGAEHGRVLASPKARRLAAEAGLDLALLVNAGVPQPFHVADLETLKNLPVPSNGASAVSHVSATVPAEGFEAFALQMRGEGGVSVALGHLVVAFAAAGLRKATQSEHLTLSMKAAGAESLTFADPDLLRLSVLSGRGVPSDATPDMALRDDGEGYVTAVVLSDVTSPTLSFSRAANAIHLTLSFPPGDLTPDQAIETMHEVTVRIADPMLALV